MNNLFTDEEFLSLTRDLWAFLSPSVPEQALKFMQFDAIFVFGGIGIEIPEHAATLFELGLSSKIIVTGKSGAYTHNYFSESESIVFQKVLIDKGIPSKNIIVEEYATNAGENVSLGMSALKEAGMERVQNLVLVCRSFMMLRAIATFKKQYPQVHCVPSPPPISITELNLPKDRIAKRLIAEIERIDNYYEAGFIEHVIIPESIRTAVKKLSEAIQRLET